MKSYSARLTRQDSLSDYYNKCYYLLAILLLPASNYDEDCDSDSSVVLLFAWMFIGTFMSVNSLRLSSIVLISGTRRIDAVRDDEARSLFDVIPLSSILA